MNSLNTLNKILAEPLRQILEGLPKHRTDKLEEIRLRTGKPLALTLTDGRYFAALSKGSSILTKEPAASYIVTNRDIADTLTLVSNYSLYAFEEEIRNGFITVKGGHRVGLCGKAVTENGDVKTLRSISSLNIRVSHEIRGSANKLMRHIVANGNVRHTLIISPPGKGKTTLLRDIVRQLSDGLPGLGFPGADIGVVDERSEIAGMFMGVPQNDVGARTDVLDCCPKAKGMHMLLRSMSPDVVAVDEIGRKEDVSASEEILNAGVALICTVHGNGTDDIRMKPYLSALIEKRMFKVYVVLSGGGRPGIISGVFDETMKELVV